MALCETEMVHFHQVEQQRDAGHGEHEEDKDCLLGRARDVAVHRIGARPAIAGVHGLELEAVQEVLSYNKGHFKQRLEDDVEDVGSQQRALQTHVPLVVFNRGLLGLVAK